MEFRILGPLEICSGPTVIGLAAAKERALLARLLVDANQVVSSDRLVEELWEGSPPDSAMTSVRVLVSRLRKTLGEIDDASVLVTRAPGYLVMVEPGGLDASRFEGMAARGRAQASAGDAEGAARIFREALDLWRGPALADGGDIERIRMEAARLEESRLGVLEDRVEADLACGREAELVSELEALTASHPGRERLWSQRMLALYRTGRQAEALSVYGQLKDALDAELGIEPSPELVKLETAIIRQDASLDRVAVARSVDDGPALPSGVVTFLLTDIEGSTPLWETKPAAMATALERHDELMRSVVASHDGTLLRTRGEGDSTFSVFARATDGAEAALEAQSMLASEVWTGGIELRVRMALMTGESVEREGDYFGTTVNRAARLRGIAEAGQILVSRSTADVIVDHLEGAELVELGEQSLRGLRRPERIYALASTSVGAPDLPSPVAIEVPIPSMLGRIATGVFVSRETELEELATIWDDVGDGERKLILLVGEAGIGKSRLAAEFALRTHKGGSTVLYGRCDEDGGEPYQPFAEAIRTLITANPGAASGTTQLARLIPDLLPELGQPTESGTDPETERRALFEAVAKTVDASSLRSSVVVVIDDLHWAARPTLRMLRHLLRAEGEARVLVVATYRDTDVDRTHPLAETLADLRREVDMTRIPLSGLDVDAIVAYVEATSGQALDEAERELADVVHGQTAGNPFFVVEVMRHFVDIGAIYRADGRWHTDVATIDAAGLPEGVRDVVGRRLGRLAESANRTLATAAAIGPDFPIRVLEQLAEDADGVIDDLERAVRAGLIVETAPGQYAFSHALIRQTLYEEMTSTKRARLHRRIGEAIEESPGAVDQVDALAHHFAEAALDGQISKAVDYSLAAARRAMERLAPEEALTRLERGIELLELDVTVDHARRSELLHASAIAKWARGDRDGARELTMLAAADARKAGDVERLARIAVLRSAVGVILVEDPLTRNLCEEALRALGADHPLLRARVLGSLAKYLALSEGRAIEATALGAEAVELARAAGDLPTLASVVNAQQVVLAGLGRPDEQLALADELIELARELKNTRTLGEGVIARSVAHFNLADIAAHRSDIAALEQLGKEQNWWHPTSFAAVQRAAIATMEGRFQEAETLAARATELSHGDLEIFLATAGIEGMRTLLQGDGTRMQELFQWLQGNTSVLAQQGMNIVEALPMALAGDLPAARHVLDQSLDGNIVDLPFDFIRPVIIAIITTTCDITRHAGPAPSLREHLLPFAGRLITIGRGGGAFGPADHFLGVCAGLLEDWDDAEARFAASLQLAEHVGSPVFAAHTELSHARMLIDRGDPADRERARGMLQRASTLGDEFGMAFVSKDSKALLASM